MTQPARPASGRLEAQWDWTLQPLEGLPDNVSKYSSLCWAILAPSDRLMKWNNRDVSLYSLMNGPLLESVGQEQGMCFRPDGAPTMRELDGELRVLTTWEDLPVSEEHLRRSYFVCRSSEVGFLLRMARQTAQVVKVKRGYWYVLPIASLLNTATPQGARSHTIEAFRKTNGHAFRWEAVFNIVSRGSASTTAELWTRRVVASDSSSSGEHPV